MLRTADPRLTEYGFDRQRLVDFILGRCLGYGGGFTFAGNFESHSGLTYCALATLKLLDYELADDAR